MVYKGNLQKMHASNPSHVQYQLQLGEQVLDMNALIGKELQFKYTGLIHCCSCGKRTRKSYAQGYCYTCFTSLPQTDVGILHPEKDRSHLGIARDMEWAKENSLIPHWVYLAVSDKLKVGVTRHTQVPTRWIDQGALKAIRLAKAPNRHIAGTIEVAMKAHFADKTSWKAMLYRQSAEEFDLKKEKERAIDLLHPEFKKYVSEDNEVVHIHYPMEPVEENIQAINLAKTKEFSGKLSGIKGQYLVFESGQVFNVRNYGGYWVELEF